MPAMKKVASKKTKPEDLGSIFTKLIDKIPPDTPSVEFDVPPEWLKMTKRSKPVDYQYIKRNIYPTKKKIKRRFEDDGIFCSCNTTMGSTVVCGRDCHCGMLRSTCSSGCRCGSSCLNKPFHQRPVKKMKVVKTEKCGSGVVAHEDIKQGEFVIEYVGEVIDDKTCEERLWEMKRSGETNFYLCEINRDMVIDATYKGNISRYINHSCSPNTEMQKWTIDGETRIGIFAIRGIKRGEQLTYDYQFVQFGADQDCHCGAAGCRKKLGAKANKLKMSSSDAALQIVSCQVAAHTPVKVIRPWEDDNQSGVLRIGSSRNAANERECTGYCIDKIVRIKGPGDTWKFGLVKRFHSHTGKHTIMFEDGQHEVLDMSKEDWKFFPE